MKVLCVPSQCLMLLYFTEIALSVSFSWPCVVDHCTLYFEMKTPLYTVEPPYFNTLK